MRILLVIYGSLEQRTGGFRYDRKLVEVLRSRGHEVIIHSQSSGSFPIRLLEDRPRRLLEAVESAKAELLLEDELNFASLIRSNRFLSRNGGPPIVTIVHHLSSKEEHGWVSGFLIKTMERRYLKGVSGAVFNTPNTRDSVAELIGGELDGVVAVPSAEGLDTPGLPRKFPEGRGLRLLSVGALIRRKRIDAVIGALALAGDPSIRLTIVGSHDAEPATARYLTRLPKSLGVSDQVSFIGPCDDQELHQQYDSHDLFVLPSQFEGFGMVYLEAMTRGMPVIASSGGGAGALVSPGVNGFLCPPGSAAGVAAAVRSIIEEPDLLEELSRGALESASKHPSWEQTFAPVVSFFETLLGRGQRGL